MTRLTLGYSPCPNDTFIFYALAHGRIDTHDLRFDVRLEDVETLNRMALAGALDITKLSVAALGQVVPRYALLDAGGAVGRGCGPLLVGRPGAGLQDLRQAPVLVPGRLTTAHLLLQLQAGPLEVRETPYHRILPDLAAGRARHGVLIHEGRFTYRAFGLEALVDLGQWWEETTGCPIPLGAVAARRRLGTSLHRRLEAFIRQSLAYARQHPDEAAAYVRRHAQELAPEVIRSHIDLYVTSHSHCLGSGARAAIDALLVRGAAAGLFPLPLLDRGVQRPPPRVEGAPRRPPPDPPADQPASG